MSDAPNVVKRCRAGGIWLAFQVGLRGRATVGTTEEQSELHPLLRDRARNPRRPLGCLPSGFDGRNSPSRTNGCPVSLRGLVVVDEVQIAPQLFPLLRVLAD